MRLTELHTPLGARDILPAEAWQKAWAETRLHELFTSWGYQPVVTPTLEFYDSLAVGNGAGLAAQTYRLLERDGSMLALRPEVTTPIARLVATRLRDERKPLRLRYVGSVFRYDQPQAGRLREFTQAGVELIGAAGHEADAEIVALAVQALRSVGLCHFHVDIGHAGFFAGIVQGAQVGPDVEATLRHTLLERDFVALEDVVRNSMLPTWVSTALLALSDLRGGLEVLDRGAELAPHPASQAALANLRRVYDLLIEMGVADAVAIDLGLVKDLEYYTGLVLEGYTREVGFTLCTGGRYDGLLGRFGYNCPATGFALGVERTLLALERQGSLPQCPGQALVRFYASAARFGEAAACAQIMRGQGYAIELNVLPTDPATATVTEPDALQVVFAGAPSNKVQISSQEATVSLPSEMVAADTAASIAAELMRHGVRKGAER